MAAFILRRLLFGILIVLGSSIAIFFLSRVVPADPVRMAVGLDASNEMVEQYRELWGMNLPLWQQYLVYMVRTLQGDFGVSMVSRQPVAQEVLTRFPATLELALTASGVFIAISLALGAIAGITRNRRADTAIRFFSIGSASLPTFWVGLVLQVVFYATLGILPAVGRLDPRIPPPTQITGLYVVDSLLTGNGPALRSSIEHLILPAATIVLAQVGLLTRIFRASVVRERNRAYATAARAKGLSERTVFSRHVFRNAVLPALTLAGIQLGWLLTGTVVVESIFAWPGLGRWAVRSIISFDYAPVMAVALFATVLFVMINLAVDVLYTFVDPRIRS